MSGKKRQGFDDFIMGGLKKSKRKLDYETANMFRRMSSHDRIRLFQCVFCSRDPDTCGCTEKDENEKGMGRQDSGALRQRQYTRIHERKPVTRNGRGEHEARYSAGIRRCGVVIPDTRVTMKEAAEALTKVMRLLPPLGESEIWMIKKNPSLYMVPEKAADSRDKEELWGK